MEPSCPIRRSRDSRQGLAAVRRDLTPQALSFVAKLARKFEPRRLALVAARGARQAKFDAGLLPDFLPDTQHVREADWKVAPVPRDLQDRRVEITGPTDRKMVINALNSGANVFMADFEDSNTPTWDNHVAGPGQPARRGAPARSSSRARKARYRLNDKIATLLVRPRGWHLHEKHVLVDGEPMSGSLFDFGAVLLPQRQGAARARQRAYFYLPKMESHLEARLWNDVFVSRRTSSAFRRARSRPPC